MKGVFNFEKGSLYENLITNEQNKEATIEYCIAGLRERLPSSCELHVVCGNNLESMFPQLKITDKCLFKCGHEVLKLLYIYHTEVVMHACTQRKIAWFIS